MLDAAYRLFCQHGIKAVGVDTIIAKSGVAKMTVYRHFASKDELVLEVLKRREALWTRKWLVEEVLARSDDPAERLLAIFDVFDGWFRRRSFEGCLFVNVLLEVDDRKHPTHRHSREQLARIRHFIAGLADDAGIDDPDGFSRQWHILMKGSIVSAGEGDVDAALRAKAIGRVLLGSVLPVTGPEQELLSLTAR